MNLAAVVALPLLTGCSGIDALIDAAVPHGTATPIVRGSNGGIAHMTLISCPRSDSGIEAARELLQQMITYNSELVLARSGGSATLTINACPSGAPGIAAVPATPRR